MAYIKWLGHAAFEIELSGKRIYIDPWITNPKSPIKMEDIEKADFVIVTHDHGDHLGEAIKICKKTGATFVAIFELANYAQQQGVKNAIGANIGGPIKLADDLVAVLTPAYHSATRGAPTGVVLIGKEGTIYHAGDTGLFAEMSFIGELYKPKIALLPIGGHFTMGPMEAAKACELLNCEIVIPMHYQTFPVISGSPEELKKEIEKRGLKTRVVILKPGEKFEF